MAKLCSQCEDLFGEALKHLQRETLKGLWDREWIPRVAGKQAGYHALAEYHQSRVSDTFLTLLMLTTDFTFISVGIIFLLQTLSVYL